VEDSEYGYISRPNGGNFILTGILMIIGGILGYGLTLAMSDSYDDSVRGLAVPLRILSIAVMPTGTILFCLGHIIRAIWFLPGFDKKIENASQPDLDEMK
jgi:hypothetical protein